MSFLGLSIAGSALDAYQQAADVTSENISNVNTPGASRQTVELQEAPSIPTTPGTTGTGVVVQSIARIHQDSYDGLFRGASSAQNYFTVQQQELQSVQSAFGEPNNGVNAAFTALQTAISQLASNPTQASDQQGVITAAQSFTTTLNSVGDAVQTAQSSVQQQAATTVSQVNSLLDQIASLNGQIRAATAVGNNPNTYEDQRDEDIDQLSQYISTQTTIQANGSALVSVNGQALVNDTQAYHLAAPVVSAASGTPTLVVGFANDPNPSNPAPVNAGSGELGGYLDLYNSKLASYTTQLNSFASAAANAIDRVTTAGYDQNGNAGAALLQSSVSGQPISATNITVGITNPVELPTALASTAAGDLTVALNAANDSVSSSQPLLANTTLMHPGVAGAGGVTTGTLTVTVDGVAQTFNYNYGAGGNADSIDDFVNNFNDAHLGVTASYDATAQKIVFARDPNNVDAAHLAAQGANPTTPSFTIGDSNAAAGGSQGTGTTSLLEMVGAAGIDGVVQDSGNAFAAGDNAGANALLQTFTKQTGIPAVQTAAATAAPAGPGSLTVSAASAGAFDNVAVGQQLTIDANTANAENVTVTAVNQAAGTITFTATKTHAAGFSIATTATQTLSGYYGTLVAQLGADTQTATTGTTAQTSLASSIDSARQSVDGINIDEETQNLVKYQNSYQAAAQTMNVLDQLLAATIAMIPTA